MKSSPNQQLPLTPTKLSLPQRIREDWVAQEGTHRTARTIEASGGYIGLGVAMSEHPSPIVQALGSATAALGVTEFARASTPNQVRLLPENMKARFSERMQAIVDRTSGTKLRLKDRFKRNVAEEVLSLEDKQVRDSTVRTFGGMALGLSGIHYMSQASTTSEAVLAGAAIAFGAFDSSRNAVRAQKRSTVLQNAVEEPIVTLKK
jgi:hypothetical protein